jgi:hypothetical protein
MSEELKKEFEKAVTINIDMKPVLMYGKRATDEIADWWLKKLAKQQEEFVKRIMKIIIMKNFEIIDKEYGRIILAEDLFQEFADIKSKLNK